MNRFTRYQPRRLPRSYEDVQMELHGAHAPDEQEAEQAAEFWPALDRLARLGCRWGATGGRSHE